MVTITQWITGESDVNTKKTRRKRNESRNASKNPSVRAQTGDRTDKREAAYRKKR